MYNLIDLWELKAGAKQKSPKENERSSWMSEV